MGLIIGLTGYAGVGKTTVAKYLAENHGFTRVNFKDGLVEEMKERLPDTLVEMVQILSSRFKGITEGVLPDGNDVHVISNEEMAMMVDNLFKVKPPLMRALMQNYGTEVRRKDDKNYWVNEYSKTITNSRAKNFVTDDVRFQNEYDTVKLSGGIIIRVVRPDITTGGGHSSETEQESFEADFTIVGEPGSHESIYKQIESIIETIKSNHD